MNGQERIMGRRGFITSASAGVAGLALGGYSGISRAAEAVAPAVGNAKNPLPRWRGFNLLDFFQAFNMDSEHGQGMVSEDDLRWIRDWGFDFIRLPMDYWLWIDTDWRTTRTLKPEDAMKVNTGFFDKIDRAVELCRKYQLHLNLNFHRAPGYCCNPPRREPFSLWIDPLAQDAFVFHWDLFARRYKGVSEKELSFNLVNEPPRNESYARVMTRATEAIRKHSPDRLIIHDGELTPEMYSPAVGQSMHMYWPGDLTHYRAPWLDKDGHMPMPTWPLKNKDGSIKCDRRMMADGWKHWTRFFAKGVGVHVGETGCYSKTPHPVFMAWFTDVMETLKPTGIGYALWEFRGGFGILDSGRDDVQYEDWYGHKLDRQLLALMQKN